MNIRLTCSHPEKMGYAVGFYYEPGYRGGYYSSMAFSKLAPGLKISTSNFITQHSLHRSRIEIDKADYDELVELIKDISITPEETISNRVDEIKYILQIESDVAEVLLSWEAYLPESWGGVQVLIETIETIIKQYNKRLQLGWGYIPQISDINKTEL